MRAQRQEIHLLKTGNANEEDILNAQTRYRVTSAEYTRFSEQIGLPQQRERVTVDGLGKIGANSRFVSGKTVAKSGESGIIKENSKKSITKITDKAIERVPNISIDGYSKEQCSEIQKQHRELLVYARTHNDSKEVAFVFKEDLIDRREPIIGTDEKLNFGNALNGKNLFVMHNHPRNSSFSFDDLVEFIGNPSIKTLTIVKNIGEVEVLTKRNHYDKLSLLRELDRQKRKNVKLGTDAEYRKVIDKFIEKYEGIEVIKWQK